jgi:hypothetical protein
VVGSNDAAFEARGQHFNLVFDREAFIHGSENPAAPPLAVGAFRAGPVNAR